MWRDSDTDRDFLNFTELSEQLAQIVQTPHMLPISIGVFGGWGTGKSTVLRLLERQLVGAADKVVVVHFDAWLYQGFDDARAALMETIAERLLKVAEAEKSLVERVKDFAKRIRYFRALGLIADFGASMSLGVPPGLVTLASSAISSLADGKGLGLDAGELKEAASSIGTTWKELVKSGEPRTPPKEITAFRVEFGEILAELDRTLVIFIDNLDRCLPEVAIQTLEAVRLFLFIDQTAFVIAADEDMIRHSVQKHFADPGSAHVRDYLDKVIQLPMRVPLVGTDDLRAYMYSLFVQLDALEELDAVQAALLTALQRRWDGTNFSKTEIATVAKKPALVERFGVVDSIAPLLASAPEVRGNPRIVKRLLNQVMLRHTLAKQRHMNVDVATLAKLAVFQRCTGEAATLALFSLINSGDGRPAELAALEADPATAPLLDEWKHFDTFVRKWASAEPLLGDMDLRPAVFLSRDSIAPASHIGGLSEVARQNLEALMKLRRFSSPAGRAAAERIPDAERAAVMSSMVASLRKGDLSDTAEGIHGSEALASVSPAARAILEAFVRGVDRGSISPGIDYFLTDKGYLPKKV